MIVSKENIDYFVFGMKRSGHHAIINWILNHYDSFIYYNNCIIKNNKLHYTEKNGIIKNGTPPYEIKLLSFEDRKNINQSSIKSISKIKKPIKNILIIRDAYNNYASRFEKKINKSNANWVKNWHNYDDVEIWKNYAKEFIGETNYLNAIKINYNLWFQDIEYRKEISKNFGVFTDKGFEEVPKFGNGSSFDYKKFDNHAQKMKVLERWKNFYNDSNYYKKIVLDKEIKELNEKIFNFSLALKKD